MAFPRKTKAPLYIDPKLMAELPVGKGDRTKKEDPKKRGLSAKQCIFVLHYLQHGSATEAYRVAFPSRKKNEGSLRHDAHRLVHLPQVEQAIQDFGKTGKAMILAGLRQRADEAAEERAVHELTRTRVMQELHRIAYADIGDFFLYDEDGRPHLRMDRWSREKSRAVKKIKIKTRRTADGVTHTDIEFELLDKLEALGKIGAELGMFKAGGDDLPKLPEEQQHRAAQAREQVMKWLEDMQHRPPPTITQDGATAKEKAPEPFDPGAQYPLDRPDPRFPV